MLRFVELVPITQGSKQEREYMKTIENKPSTLSDAGARQHGQVRGGGRNGCSK